MCDSSSSGFPVISTGETTELLMTPLSTGTQRSVAWGAVGLSGVLKWTGGAEFSAPTVCVDGLCDNVDEGEKEGNKEDKSETEKRGGKLDGRVEAGDEDAVVGDEVDEAVEE